jgi:hypothetical protein
MEMSLPPKPNIMITSPTGESLGGSSVGRPVSLIFSAGPKCIVLRDKQLMDFDPDGLPSSDGDSVMAPQRKMNPSGLELLGHTDYFIVSRSKMLEGVGSYIVISVGTKSFNGHIMMGLFIALTFTLC